VEFEGLKMQLRCEQHAGKALDLGLVGAGREMDGPRFKEEL